MGFSHSLAQFLLWFHSNHGGATAYWVSSCSWRMMLSGFSDYVAQLAIGLHIHLGAAHNSHGLQGFDGASYCNWIGWSGCSIASFALAIPSSTRAGAMRFAISTSSESFCALTTSRIFKVVSVTTHEASRSSN